MVGETNTSLKEKLKEAIFEDIIFIAFTGSVGYAAFSGFFNLSLAHIVHIGFLCFFIKSILPLVLDPLIRLIKRR